MKLTFRSKVVTYREQYVYINGHRFELDDLLETLEEGINGLDNIRVTNMRMAKVLQDVGVLKYRGSREIPAWFHQKPTMELIKKLKARYRRIENAENAERNDG